MTALYRLSESAQQDILSIRDYSMAEWGKVQTGKYLARLQKRIEWLANNPALGKKRDEIKHGYISLPEGRHIIFYRGTTGGIEVMGVVHQSEDIDVHSIMK